MHPINEKPQAIAWSPSLPPGCLPRPHASLLRAGAKRVRKICFVFQVHWFLLKVLILKKQSFLKLFLFMPDMKWREKSKCQKQKCIFQLVFGVPLGQGQLEIGGWLAVLRLPPGTAPSSSAMTLTSSFLGWLCERMILALCQVVSHCLSQIILSATLQSP